jgi:hypothetical protein
MQTIQYGTCMPETTHKHNGLQLKWMKIATVGLWVGTQMPSFELECQTQRDTRIGAL